MTTTSTPATIGKIDNSRGNKLLTIEDVLGQIPVGRTNWLKGVRSGKYPAPVYISPRRPVWKQSALDSLIDSL